MARPLNGMFHVREVAYAPRERQATHAHEFMSVTLVISGAIRERVGRAEAVGTPLSVVVKPAGVEHSDEFGLRGARTVQMAFDPGMLSAGTDQDPGFRSWRWHHGGPVAAEMLALVRLIRRASPADSVEADNRAVDVLGALAREPRPRGSPPRWILLVKDRLDDELGVSVRELAREAGV